MTANRKLTAPQRKALERIVRTDDHDYMTEYVMLSPSEKRMAAKLISMGLAKRVITKGQECIEPTALGRAALGTSADAEPGAPLTFNGGADAVDDDPPVQDGVPWYVDPSANYMLFQSTTNPDELWSMGFEGPFKDIDHAQAAADDLKELAARPHPAPDAPTADAATDGDVATTFDALVMSLREALSNHAIYHTDMPHDASPSISRLKANLADFILVHAATIRAALVGNAPPELRVGDTAVVLAGYRDAVYADYSEYPTIPEGETVKITGLDSTTSCEVYWKRPNSKSCIAHIPTRFLRRIDGGGVQR